MRILLNFGRIRKYAPMWKVTLPVLLLSGVWNLLPAQSPLQIKRTFGGIILMQDGKYLKLKDASRITKPVPEAYKLVRAARVYYSMSHILGITGGFLAGYSLSNALNGNPSGQTAVKIGGALFFSALPFAFIANHKLKKAVRIYNQPLSTSQLHVSASLYPGGVRLYLIF